MTEHGPTPAPAPAACEITDKRTLKVERLTGTVEWTVNEFDGGQRCMLSAASGGVQFSAYFDADQWAAFQQLAAGEQS